jgi:hypothetical protein
MHVCVRVHICARVCVRVCVCGGGRGCYGYVCHRPRLLCNSCKLKPGPV